MPAGSEERFFSRYIDLPNDPLYPFGYGLSYATFEYSELRLSDDVLEEGKQIVAEIEVKNTSEVEGEEIVQLYIQDIAAEVVRPIKELKGFNKVKLAPGESKTVSFEIDETMLRYHHIDLRFTSDSGKFTVFVSGCSDIREGKSFKLI